MKLFQLITVLSGASIIAATQDFTKYSQRQNDERKLQVYDDYAYDNYPGAKKAKDKATKTPPKGGKIGPGANGRANFISVLNAGQALPLCNSTATGNAVVTYDPSLSLLCIFLGYQGLSGPEVAPSTGVGGSTISGPAVIGQVGQTLIILSSGNPKQECYQISSAEANLLVNELLYFNVLTSKCPNGEIRGQILNS